MRPQSQAHIGVDIDQVDDDALPDGRFNVLSVAQTRATIERLYRNWEEKKNRPAWIAGRPPKLIKYKPPIFYDITKATRKWDGGRDEYDLGLFEAACGFCKIEQSLAQKVIQTLWGQPTQLLKIRCKLCNTRVRR